jgi:hypothetical protein
MSRTLLPMKIMTKKAKIYTDENRVIIILIYIYGLF